MIKSVSKKNRTGFQKKADDIARQQADVQQEYIQVCADLKSSDLGSKKDQLRELEKRSLHAYRQQPSVD